MIEQTSHIISSHLSVNRNTLVRTLFLLSIVCLLSSTNAQSLRDQEIAKISTEILDLINVNLGKKRSLEESGGIWQLDSLFNLHDHRLDKGSKSVLYDSKIRMMNKDFGLDYKAQYYYNHDPFFNVADGDTEQQFFSSRLRLGLEWQLFREGLFSNQNAVKRVTKEQQIERLNELIENNDDKLYYRYNLFIYFFNQAKIKLLEQRKEQLTKEMDLLYQVYHLKGILYEDILNAKSRLEQVSVRIDNYKTYNQLIDSTLSASSFGSDFNALRMPVLDLQLDKLVQDDQRQKLVDSLDRLYADVEALKNKPVNELSLKLLAFQNFGFRNDGAGTDRTYTSYGVSFGLPLDIFFKGEDTRRLSAAKNQYRQQFNEYELLNNKTEIVNYYYEYKYKLTTYVAFIHKEMMYQEQVRMEVIQQKDYQDIYRSLQTLKHLDLLRSIQLEMLDLKQQMYLLLLKIYGKTHHRAITPFIKDFNASEYYQRLPGTRSLLLDQADLEEHNSYFIKNYLLANDFEQLIIRTNGIIGEKAKTFKKLLEHNSIRVLLMTGNESMLAEAVNDQNKMTHFLNEQQFHGLVIDLSNPNQLSKSIPDFMQQVKNTVFDIHAVSTSAKTKINVNLSIDQLEYLEQLGWCSKVSIRLDNNGQLKKIGDLLRSGRISQEKLAMVIPADQFENRVKLEAFIDEAINMYQLKNITISGLNDFITLDTKVLTGTE